MARGRLAVAKNADAVRAGLPVPEGGLVVVMRVVAVVAIRCGEAVQHVWQVEEGGQDNQSVRPQHPSPTIPGSPRPLTRPSPR